MRTTEQQKNRLRILKRAIDRAFRKLVARGRKLSIEKIKYWDADGSKLPQHLDTLFTAISGLRMAPLDLLDLDRNIPVHSHIIDQALDHLYFGKAPQRWLENTLLRDLFENGGEYELMSQMPRAKREYTPRPKQTRVESHAAKVDAKVVEWERKMKLARTKLAKYKKRQKYYLNKKKGAKTT